MGLRGVAQMPFDWPAKVGSGRARINVAHARVGGNRQFRTGSAAERLLNPTPPIVHADHYEQGFVRVIRSSSSARRLNSAALASLRFFEATARLSSFGRAAAELSVTQGAVSHQIKYLEDFLGSKLFYRLPKQIRLTEEGEKFAAVVARALKELEEGVEAVTALTRPTIDIRLRVGPSFALRWLVPRLGRLHARHPNIKLHVIGVYGYFDPVHRDFDVALEFLQSSVPALHAEVLMEEYLTPVCSPEYLRRHGPLRGPADLGHCTLLHDGDAWEAASEDAEWRYWLDEIGAREIDSHQGQFFTLANMAIEAALSHQGIAMGRLSLVEELLASGKLVAPFPQRIKCPTCYYLVYPKELAGRPGVKAVTEWLREEAEMLMKTRVDGTEAGAKARSARPVSPPSSVASASAGPEPGRGSS